MNWFKIVLDSDQVASGEAKRLLLAVTARGAIKDFGLFTAIDNRPGTATYYLPPSATGICPEILEKYAASECAPPARNSIGIAVGSGETLDHLLPNNG
jgi:hypothetical protein